MKSILQTLYGSFGNSVNRALGFQPKPAVTAALSTNRGTMAAADVRVRGYHDDNDMDQDVLDHDDGAAADLLEYRSELEERESDDTESDRTERDDRKHEADAHEDTVGVHDEWPEATSPRTESATETGLMDLLKDADDARNAGQTDAATGLLEAAAARFPEAAQVPHDLAKLAEHGRDWVAAERWWRRFGQLSPNVGWVAGRTAGMLRAQGRIADAEALLVDAKLQHPNEVGLFFDHARLAEHSRDWAEAEARWTEVAERFPHLWDGPGGQARALRERGHPDQARARLLQTREAYPTASGPLQELACLAESERDWVDAEQLWRAWVDREPKGWWGFVGLARSLNRQGHRAEAEAVLAGQFESLAHERNIFIEHARLAEEIRDWPEAERRWNNVLEQFPAAWDGHAGKARALRERGQVAEARQYLRNALERDPASPNLLHDLARLEELEKNWDMAAELWQAVLAVDQTLLWAYTGLATARREQGRIAEAEAVLTAQFAKMPHESRLFIEYARLAERPGAMLEALPRWDDVIARFPDLWDGYAGKTRILREQSCFDEAKSVVTDAGDRCTDKIVPLQELARIADARFDWPESKRLWTQVVALDNASVAAQVNLARALTRLECFTEAERLLSPLTAAFPQELGVFTEYAWIAENSKDWPEAAARWADAAARFPEHYEACNNHARALQMSGMTDEAQQVLLLAVARHPGVPQLIQGLARLAETRQDWRDAERRWRTFVQMDPGQWYGHVGIAKALAVQGRADEADAVLLSQINQFKVVPAFLAEYAALADRAKKVSEAESRWREVVVHFPDDWRGYAGRSRNLREQQRFAEAAAVLAEAAQRKFDQGRLSEEHARVAEAQRDWVAAEAAWRNFIAGTQSLWWAYTGLFRTQCRQGRIDDALATFGQARTRFPATVYVFIDAVRALAEERCFPPVAGITREALACGQPLSSSELLTLAWLALQCEAIEEAISIAMRLRAETSHDDSLLHESDRFQQVLMKRLAEVAPGRLVELGWGNDSRPISPE